MTISFKQRSQYNLELVYFLTVLREPREFCGRIAEAITTGISYLWASPNTMLGLIFMPIAILTGGKVQFVSGVIEIYGGFVQVFLVRMLYIEAKALTVGHVVIGQTAEWLERTRAHERVHVRQYQVWGVAFLPAYFLSSGLAWYQGRNPYLDNRFEREAYRIAPV